MQNGDASLPNGLHDKLASEPYKTAVYVPKPPRSRNPNRKFSSELTQARIIQNIAHQLTVEIGKDIASAPDSAARKGLAVSLRMAVMAWETACDRVRIARGKPLPGSLRPEYRAAPKTQRPKPSSSTFTETPDPQTETPSPASPQMIAKKESLSGEGG